MNRNTDKYQTMVLADKVKTTHHISQCESWINGREIFQDGQDYLCQGQVEARDPYSDVY